MKGRTRGNAVLKFMLALSLALVLLMSVTGCTRQLTEDEVAKTESSTAASDTAKKDVVTALKSLQIKNGNYDYTYTYKYDFDKKTCTITGKNIPAGDSSNYEALSYYFCPSILVGETLEALPDISGAYEELTLWTQPLMATDYIDTYKLVIYENDAKSPYQTVTYSFKKNSSDQITTCNVTRQYVEGDDVDYVIHYKYTEDGTLRSVKENAEYRDMVWEFNRENGKLTSSTLTITDKDEEATNTNFTTLEYIYDTNGRLKATVQKMEVEDGDPLEYRTDYTFSEKTNQLSTIKDKWVTLTLDYNDSLQNLTEITVQDDSATTTTYKYTYAEFEY